MEFRLSTRQGQMLVEAILVMGLAAVLLPALITAWVASRSGKAQQEQRSVATGLLIEASEATRVVRERGWTSFAIDGTFHPATASGTWTLASGSEIVNGYTRSIVISPVRRDSSGIIVSSGGSIDPSTKKVDFTVQWNSPLVAQVATSAYMTRYLDNLAWIQTTQADFNAGIKAATAVTNNSGGEVVLGAGGQGDWCAPNLSITALDLPKNGVANALTAIEGRAFAGTGDNSSGVSFANVSISNANPPVTSILGTYDGFKTNDVFGETNYAYLATDNHGKEIDIINLSSTPYTEAGYFNAPGNGDGNSVFVSGSVGYMTSGNNFYTFDLASKSGSRGQLGTVTLAGTGNSIFVVGSYAFVAIGGATEMQIINVANPSSLSIVGQADVNGQAAKDVFVNATGTRAYLVTGTSASQPEFFIIDVATKTGNRPTAGSFDTNGMDPRGVTVVTGNKAIAVGHSGEEYQAINITNESTPTHCGGLQVNTGINGVASVVEQDGDAYSYIITGDASSELKIIAGGPGGQYASSGTFTSSILDVGYSTAFNYVSFTTAVPSNTSIQFQLAAADPVAGSCTGANFIYVGPDGTSSTFFGTAGGSIPINDDGAGFENPSQCLRYKAYLATLDLTQTPQLDDVTVNYSP